MNPTRRKFLQMGAGASMAGAIGAPLFAAGRMHPAGAASRTTAPDPAAQAPAAAEAVVSRRVALLNLHTGERLDLEYYRGRFLPEALGAIRILLRDFRNDEQHDIDPKLLDYLYDVARHAGVDPTFSVISGYRSPQTNEKLRERGSGVAQHSLHMEGRAIDVRLAGIDCAELAGRALELTRGGVGYYRKSDFVHLDTGAFRTWKG
jgi:uncharacterized protein YcbK (DUF882 family)